jgi:SAM-dependent methyltransferase
VTRTPKRPSGPRAARGAERGQTRYWNSRYRSDPSLFGAGRSPFLRWLLTSLGNRPVGRAWVELGSGYGRDLRELKERGYSVRGIDLSHVGTSIARRAGLDAERGHALEFLARQRPESVDVVFSNLFLNMDFSEADHERLFSLVHRVLVPGDSTPTRCARSRTVGTERGSRSEPIRST